jgi:hypothetical protein
MGMVNGVQFAMHGQIEPPLEMQCPVRLMNKKGIITSRNQTMPTC